MKIYNELESLGFFEWLSETYNLKDSDMKPEYLDELPLNDIHRTVGNSMALRWFREKHNLCGEVYTVNMGAIDYTFQIRDLYSEDIKHDNFEAYTSGYIGTFLTYEEAESTCLDKLIEICKNK